MALRMKYLLEERQDDQCLRLISMKSFAGEKDACSSFELTEIIELNLDEETDEEFIKGIKNLTKTNGKVDPKEFEAL